MATDILAYIIGGIATYFYFKSRGGGPTTPPPTLPPPPPPTLPPPPPPPPQALTLTLRAYGLDTMTPVPFLEGIPMTLSGSPTKPTVAIFNITSMTAYTFSVANTPLWLFDHWDLPIGATGNPTSRSQSIASSNISILSYNARMKPVPITQQDSISVRAYNMNATQYLSGISVLITNLTSNEIQRSYTPSLTTPLAHDTAYNVTVHDTPLWEFDHWDFDIATNPTRIPTNRTQPINVPRAPGPLSFNARFRPK